MKKILLFGLLSIMLNNTTYAAKIPALGFPLEGERCDYQVVLNYGVNWRWKKCGNQWYTHAGVDYQVPGDARKTVGKKVYAAYGGVIKKFIREESTGWRGLVVIESVDSRGQKFCHVYWHLGNFPRHIKQRAKVVKGQYLGKIASLRGKSTDHLHFAVYNGVYDERYTFKGALPKRAGCGLPKFPGKFVNPNVLFGNPESYIQSPANGAKITGNNVIIKWNSPSSNKRYVYRIQIKNRNRLVVNKYVGYSRSYNFSPKSGETYEVRIKHFHPCYGVSYTPYRKFSKTGRTNNSTNANFYLSNSKVQTLYPKRGSRVKMSTTACVRDGSQSQRYRGKVKYGLATRKSYSSRYHTWLDTDSYSLRGSRDCDNESDYVRMPTSNYTKYKYFVIKLDPPSNSKDRRSADNWKFIKIKRWKKSNQTEGSLSQIVEHDIDQILVYPNPAQQFIRLKNIRDGDVIEIFNIQGIKTTGYNYNKSKSAVDISQLQDGVYLVHIYNKLSGERTTKKFTKISK